MQEVDSRMATIDLNGKEIISDCKEMISFLKEKLAEMRISLQSYAFDNEANEIHFFKVQKPTLLGRLLYFYKILRIESQRPLDNEALCCYYEKQQGGLKLFFDRHLAFYQYYRSGATYMDKHYFLRGRQEGMIDVDVCYYNDDVNFSTGYDHLVARIIAMEMLYTVISFRRTCLLYGREGSEIDLLKVRGSYRWSGNIADLVELIYALDEVKCINNGEVPITELAMFFGTLFGVDLRDCYGSYVYMKKRKNESRTYFLDRMSKELNKRMYRDDEKEIRRK